MPAHLLTLIVTQSLSAAQNLSLELMISLLLVPGPVGRVLGGQEGEGAIRTHPLGVAGLSSS